MKSKRPNQLDSTSARMYHNWVVFSVCCGGSRTICSRHVSQRTLVCTRANRGTYRVPGVSVVGSSHVNTRFCRRRKYTFVLMDVRTQETLDRCNSSDQKRSLHQNEKRTWVPPQCKSVRVCASTRAHCAPYGCVWICVLQAPNANLSCLALGQVRCQQDLQLELSVDTMFRKLHHDT